MSSDRLSAPVGVSPRTSEGKPVKNNAKDVVILRKMLEANKIGPLGNSNTMDAGLLKAIGAYQKRIGFKNPDRVVDPKGKTEKALLPAYQKALKEAAKIQMVRVRYKNQDLELTPQDYEKLKAQVFRRVERYVDALISNHETSMDIYQEYLDNAQAKNGWMTATVQAISMTVGSVKYPKDKIVFRSMKSVTGLKVAYVKKDLKLLDKALPEAEAAINDFNREIGRFLNDLVGGAQTTVTGLKVTQATCFTIVGVLAAPVLVTGAGMSATAAAVTSGASVSILQSGANELGKHASGQKQTVWGSVKNILIDGTVGALTAGIANKIPLKFCDTMAKSLAGKLSAKVSFLSAKQLEKLLVKYLSGTGQDAIKGAIGEVVNTAGNWIKSGKAPTEKEFNEAVSKVLTGIVLSGPLKSLGGFQKKWAYQNKNILQGQILPDRLAHLAKNNNIPNTIKAKLYAEVMNKVSEPFMKAGLDEAIEQFKGDESEKQLEAIATKAAKKHRGLQKLIDVEMKKALKKYKVPA